MGRKKSISLYCRRKRSCGKASRLACGSGLLFPILNHWFPARVEGGELLGFKFPLIFLKKSTWGGGKAFLKAGFLPLALAPALNSEYAERPSPQQFMNFGDRLFNSGADGALCDRQPKNRGCWIAFDLKNMDLLCARFDVGSVLGSV